MTGEPQPLQSALLGKCQYFHHDICIGNSMIWSDIWHKYYERYFEIVIRREAGEIWDNFEISWVVFMPNNTYKSCYYLFILVLAKVI